MRGAGWEAFKGLALDVLTSESSRCLWRQAGVVERSLGHQVCRSKSGLESQKYLGVTGIQMAFEAVKFINIASRVSTGTQRGPCPITAWRSGHRFRIH